MFDLNVSSEGYFPHFHNTIGNWEYVGDLPAPSFYGYNQKQKLEMIC